MERESEREKEREYKGGGWEGACVSQQTPCCLDNTSCMALTTLVCLQSEARLWDVSDNGDIERRKN